jgi:hypothetical protein
MEKSPTVHRYKSPERVNDRDAGEVTHEHKSAQVASSFQTVEQMTTAPRPTGTRITSLARMRWHIPMANPAPARIRIFVLRSTFCVLP